MSPKLVRKTSRRVPRGFSDWGSHMSREDREGTVLMVVREWSGGEVDIWVGAWDLLGRDYPLNMPYEAASRWLSGLAVLPAWKWANGAGWGDSDPFPNCDCWKCKASVASEA